MCEMCGKFLVIPGIVSLIATGANIGSVARGAAPSEAEVQGLYEGTGSDAAGEFKIEARVVAQGDGNYNVFIRQRRGEGNLARVELKGKTEGGTVTLMGKAGAVAWKGSFAAGAFKGECLPGGTFQIHRIDRKSPTLGKKPPQGAVVLLDGKDFSEMVLRSGAKWDLGKLSVGNDGSIQVPGGGMTSIVSGSL